MFAVGTVEFDEDGAVLQGDASGADALVDGPVDRFDVQRRVRRVGLEFDDEVEDFRADFLRRVEVLIEQNAGGHGSGS